MKLAEPQDIRTALTLLTRLPISAGAPSPRMAEAAWAFPLAGLVLALLAGLITSIALWLGLSPALSAVLLLATLTVTTGAMHEDGLADTADGFWGGWDREKRLAIMKDSHIGTYGVLALILSFAARWAALTVLISQGNWLGPLIATACLSRAAMPVLMHALPNARETGLSHHAGRPGRDTVLLGIACAGLIALLCTGATVITLAAIAALTVALVGSVARAKIGGQTGDVLGAAQQITEITLLAALAA